MTENMSWARRSLDYEPPDIDTSAPHPARIYNYILDGGDNYLPDREAAERMLGRWPALRTSMRQGRLFMERVTRYLAAERGIDQFLDIGVGIPVSPNLHEIAQRINPAARVVYVDNDPIVFTHAQARLVSAPEGRVVCLRADLSEPDTIFDAPELRATLDLGVPVAMVVLAVVYSITDDEQAYDVVRRCMERLPSGSVLALSTVTAEHKPPVAAGVTAEYSARGISMRIRTRAEISAFFDGLDLIDPGTVLVHRWRPDERSEGVLDIEVGLYGGVAVKP